MPPTVLRVFGPEYDSGGSGLCSSVADYSKFCDALANGGQGILRPETIDLLRTNQIANVDKSLFNWPQLKGYGYGLGVRIRKVATEWGLSKGEFGWDGAACSYVMIDPEKKISIFIGMHLRNWPVVFTDKHLSIVEKIYKTFKF